MQAQRSKKIVAGGVVAGAAALAAIWYNASYVRVNVSSFHPGTEIQLAAVDHTTFDDVPAWKSVEPGMHFLRKGAYRFHVQGATVDKFGLVAVDDDSPLILK